MNVPNSICDTCADKSDSAPGLICGRVDNDGLAPCQGVYRSSPGQWHALVVTESTTVHRVLIDPASPTPAPDDLDSVVFAAASQVVKEGGGEVIGSSSKTSLVTWAQAGSLAAEKSEAWASREYPPPRDVIIGNVGPFEMAIECPHCENRNSVVERDLPDRVNALRSIGVGADGVVEIGWSLGVLVADRGRYECSACLNEVRFVDGVRHVYDEGHSDA